VLHREHRGRGTGPNTKFGVDVLDVVVGRLRRDAQPLPDLLRRQAARQPAEHFSLSFGQICGQRRHGGRLSPLATRTEHSLDSQRGCVGRLPACGLLVFSRRIAW
jgi:hypothetical protein